MSRARESIHAADRAGRAGATADSAARAAGALHPHDTPASAIPDPCPGEQQPREAHGRFASPDGDLAVVEALVETGTSRHRDDRDRLEHLLSIDERRDARWMRIERSAREVERFLDVLEGRVDAAILRVLRGKLDEIRAHARARSDEDPFHDALLRGVAQSQGDHIAEHQDAAGLLERRQRTRREGE